MDVDETWRAFEEILAKATKTVPGEKRFSDEDISKGSVWFNKEVENVSTGKRRFYKLRHQSRDVHIYKRYTSARTEAKRVIWLG